MFKHVSCGCLECTDLRYSVVASSTFCEGCKSVQYFGGLIPKTAIVRLSNFANRISTSFDVVWEKLRNLMSLS